MTGVLALLVLSIVVVLLILWAILSYVNWKDARPVVLPVSEKLTAFRAANNRLGVNWDDAALLEAYSNLLPKFENPYGAAMEDWIRRWRNLTSPGGEVHYGPPTESSHPSSEKPPDSEADRIEIEQDLGLHAICDFIIERNLSNDEGKRYFDQLTEIWRQMLLRNGRPPEELTSFDSMLDAQRRKSSSPQAEQHGGVLP
jgi:hypothetical protein